MDFKKSMALGLAAIMLAAGVAGCKKDDTSDKAVTISIGGWPTEENPETLKKQEDYLAQYNEKYPDVGVKPDTGNFADAKIFTMKASAGQLPTMFNTHFTEIQQIIRDGYAADITDIAKERGLYDALNPTIRAIAEDKDGKLYGIPVSGYAMGLNINVELFEKAGLVNEDGSVKVPNTYEEMAEYAKIIKEKTGKAGYVICTTNNCGGWHFMNIAWSYGVEFMKQRDDGTWEATFDTQEAVDALQYIKDLKWKYDALPDNTVIDQAESHKLFATGQAAMLFDEPKTNFTSKYGMNKDKYAAARIPAGPAGRYVQTGGSVYVFAANATTEQINACFDWIELTGNGATLDEASLQNTEKSLQASVAENQIVFPQALYNIWTNPERNEKVNEIRAKYANVDIKNFKDYINGEDVILHAEEPMACQQLYSVLDGCIQEVITNENADCAALIKTACNDFQVNHLDKL